MSDESNFLERTLERVPALAEYFDGPFDTPAADMLDTDWMSERVAATAARWRCSDPRVNATLWWYQASSTLAFVPIATMMVTGKAADPRLAVSRCFLRPGGDLGGIFSDRSIVPGDLAAGLAESFGSIIEVLADVSGARQQMLWAIATDSIANRSLDAGAAVGDRILGSRFAAGLVEQMGTQLPTPRFLDVGGRRFTRRCSCCLLYEIEGCDKCTSCPHRTPSDRLRGLEAAARYL